MARPNDNTLEARVKRLEQRKQDTDARLSQEKAKLRDKQRRDRQRRVRESGELVELADLAHFEKAVLLGALWEVASRSRDATVIQAWQQQGHLLLAAHATQQGERPRHSNDRDALEPVVTES